MTFFHKTFISLQFIYSCFHSLRKHFLRLLTEAPGLHRPDPAQRHVHLAMWPHQGQQESIEGQGKAEKQSRETRPVPEHSRQRCDSHALCKVQNGPEVHGTGVRHVKLSDECVDEGCVFV